MSSSSIKVRFLIDRKEKRVVFAEAGRDFVDVLFSFLTLPLGAIVRLLKKRSGLGSLDSLYESIEQLDDEHFLTAACKEMLLEEFRNWCPGFSLFLFQLFCINRACFSSLILQVLDADGSISLLQMLLNPRSAAAELCEDLKIKGIHELNPRTNYTCRQDGCLIHSICYYTYSSKVLCSRCGKLMDKYWTWKKKTSEEEGVFVKATNEFMITDDLRVIPTSLLKSLSLLKEMHIKDTSMLEERVMEFGTKEVLNLLGRSLVSKNALTEVCFPDTCVQGNASSYLPIKEEIIENEAQNEIKVELMLNKKNDSVLYARVGDNFINQLFSYLAFPLGSVLKFLLDNMSHLGGCIQNLYSSVENMGLDYFRSDICRNMLLSPKLAAFYGFKNQLALELEENTTRRSIMKGSCVKCYADNGYKMCTSTKCIHKIKESKFVEQNPKSAKSLLDDSGGGFVVGCRRFGIMDNLDISLISTVSAIVNVENLHISDLVGKELSLDKCKAHSLLHAMVTSKTVLTDIFAPKRKQPWGNSMKHA